ncbi:MAG TPA: DUF72 domain-containing protein [Solirubrobacteraceae bacterium]|nr:DUF72 domain-containing protein [Solirubrobacteraceae bacterium]
MSGARVRIGCSGWQYQSWREILYPKGLAQRNWLRRYSEVFDTVEVNATFYRLAKPASVAGWLEQTPPDFLFTIKGSQYLTHMKRLLDLEQGPGRFFDSIAPALGTPKMGPVLWQLPPNFKRDDARLEAWLSTVTGPGSLGGPELRHAVEFRHESWFVPEVYGILHAHGAALVLAHDGRRDEPFPHEVTAEWSFVRLHYGARGRRGNYAEPELRDLAARVRELSAHGDVLTYFNNDWEGFAVRNGQRLQRLLASGA